MGLNWDFYISIKCSPSYVPIWLLLLFPIKTISIYVINRIFNTVSTHWAAARTLRVLPPVGVPRRSGYPYTQSPRVLLLCADMWTKHLTLVLHDTTFCINRVPCTPYIEKESSEACSGKYIHSFLPRLNTSVWVTTCLPKAEAKKVAEEQEMELYPDAFLCFPWLAVVICILLSEALRLAVALAPAATWW